MWLTTSNVDLLYRISLCAIVPLILRLWLNRFASTGDRSFKDRPRIYLPRVLTQHYDISHFGS